ncbi:hypothetical protein [Enterococcus olivae]
MMFLNFFLVGSMITGLEVRCSNKPHGQNKWVIFLLNTLFVNLFALFLLRFLLQKNQLFLHETYTFFYSIKYLLFGLVIGLSYLFIKYFIRHSAHLKICSAPRTKKEMFWLSMDSLVFLIGWFLLLFIDRIQFIGTTTQTIVTAELMDTQFLIFITGAVLFLSFLWAPVHIVNKYRTPLMNQHIRRIGGLIALLLFISSMIYSGTVLYG